MKAKTPSVRPESYRYPLELVAKLAATLLPRNVAAKYALEQYYVAAEQSVKLLDACRSALVIDLGEEKGRQRDAKARYAISLEQRNEEQALKARFPDGLSWPDYLRHVTSQPSTTDAMPRFKNWLRYRIRFQSEQDHLKYKIPVLTAEAIEQKVERELIRMQASTPDGEQPFSFLRTVFDKRKLTDWYETVAKPGVRSVAGRKGARAKKEKRTLT